MRTVLVVWMLVASTLGFACVGNDDSTSGGFCARAITKLRSCGLLTEGMFDNCEEKTDARRQCLYRCALAAPCNEYRALWCEEEEPTGNLATCIAACEPPRFECDDGSSIEGDAKCDDYPDCNGGEDEDNCPPDPNVVECADGSRTIGNGDVCDGFEDCNDGADEVGCPVFACGDGQTVPETYECDEVQDCDNGADEVGCPTFQCSNGTVGSPSWQCDDFDDCGDGSDEVGCAMLICQ